MAPSSPSTPVRSFSDRFWRQLVPRDVSPWASGFFDHVKMTLPRVLNLRRSAREYAEKAEVLTAKPVKLVIEATNVCNLNCPACFTGLGENGRVRSAIGLEFYRKVLAELGPTALEVEFYNWGEPFLCKSIFTMVEEASQMGLATSISSNLSVPFDEEKAEAIVRSGLTALGVSIDGATQENYEKYRRGGDLALVLRNAQMILDAKRRLGSSSPIMIWEYHVFPHNAEEVEMAHAMSVEMGFDLFGCDKGLTYGEEWKDERFQYFFPKVIPMACAFLWHYAVIHTDGGVAACCGAFYREDDLGRLSTGPGQPGSDSFAEIWNNEQYRHARKMFAGRLEDVAPPCNSLCGECPATKTYQDGLRHVAAGNRLETFESEFSPNDGHKYFYGRKPKRDTRRPLRQDNSEPVA